MSAPGFVARGDGRVVSTLRFWPVTIGKTVPALFLGPLSVNPGHRRRGIAATLVNRGLGEARSLGHRIVAAVGDQWFFARFRFVPAPPLGVSMPGPVDEARFLAREIEAGAFDGASGVPRAIRTRPRRASPLAASVAGSVS